MKLNKFLLVAPVILLSLTSCGKKVRYDANEYVLDYTKAADYQPCDENQSFNILQISDIHFTYLAENEYHYKFIKKTIEGAQKALGNEPLHLIVITGDTFTFATKDTIVSACNFFEKQHIPWTITFGNHDEQGYFSVDWMTGYLNKVSKRNDSNLLFIDKQDDDVFGSANFVINVDEHRQVIIMDSNRYNYGEGMGYDYIHTDQIDWYERMYHYFNNDNSSSSLAFFHIPLVEYADAYNKGITNPELFDTSNVYDSDGKLVSENFKRDVRGESESSPLVNTHFLDRIRDTHFYTKGIFVGHDHINNYAVNYNYDDDDEADIKFCYGIKATNTVYYDDAYLGGQIIKFKRGDNLNEAIKTDLVLHKYKDMEAK